MAEKIHLQDIESSNLRAIGYNPHKLILAVQFKSGPIFHYVGVPLELAAEFGGAESKGRFYSQRIKGKFTAGKMTGTCPNCGDEHGWLGDTCTDCGTAAYKEVPRAGADDDPTE